MKIILYLSLLFLSFNSYSCPYPKEGWDWDKETLITNSDSIVLAKFIVSDASEPHWEIIETLKGGKDKTFLTTFTLLHKHSNRNKKHKYSGIDFEEHTNNKFWEGNEGRSGANPTVCFMPHSFKNGELYLLFNHPFNTFSAELIKSKKDLWFQYVKNS